MGKPTGFLEFGRHDRDYAPVEERVKHWREFTEPLPAEELRRQGGRCMDCGTPYCHPACPVNNVIPDWNDLVFEGDFRTALDDAALDQQFSRLHRPDLPRALRGRLHPQPDRAAGDHQDHRARHRRARLGQRLDRAAGRGQAPHRQAHRRGRLRPRRARLRPAIGARRTRGFGLRKIAAHRRLAALRHSRFQDGKARHRPPRGADAGRGRESSTSIPMSAATCPPSS